MPPVRIVYTGQGADNDLDARLVVPGQGRTVTALKDYLANNATFTPLDYGAKGDGVTDDSAALTDCLTSAVSFGASGVAAGTPVVDLKGRVYALGSEVQSPAIKHGGLIFRNGRLVALPGFDTTKFLLAFGRLGTPTNSFRIYDLILENLYIDSAHRGGGIFVTSCMRVKAINCEFAHYAGAPGLRLGDTKFDGHEVLVIGCQFGEYWWGETGYDAPQAFVGTACEVNFPDNHILCCVMQLSKVGLKLNAGYNTVTALHTWMGGSNLPGPANIGIWLTVNGAFNTLSQLYIDGSEILWETAWNTCITDSKFLVNTDNVNFAFIRLKPMVNNASIRGVAVTECSFQASGTAAGSIKPFVYDTSVGFYNINEVKRVTIERNGFEGVVEMGSRIRRSAALAAASSTTVDFTGALLPFGTVRPALVVLDAPTVTPCQVTAKAGAVLTVTTGTAVTGTVYVEATVVTPG